MNDDVLTLHFQPGATKKLNPFNSIFSSLVTLLLQVRVRIDFKNIPYLSDDTLTLYFQPVATINRNRFNSIFSSLGTLVIQVRVRIDL